jgi:hypothetical protein
MPDDVPLGRRPRARMSVRSAALAALVATVALLAGREARAGVAEAPPGSAPAPAPAPPPESPADDLTISVVTFGPGDHPFFKFGHDAIWVHDAAAGTDQVYNFGTFIFDSPRLILDFLHGRMTYWLSVSYLPAAFESYARENRSIDVQQLALEPGIKRALHARLDGNARPENRAYKYDYFRDNCATRVRDAIDGATGGLLRASAHAPARLSLRDQALRMTADYLPLYLALDIVLGPDADRPVDRWAEMFIPQELARGLRAVTIPGRAGPHPLVAREAAVFEPSGRPPPLENPPARGPSFFLCGLGVGLLFGWLGWASRRPFLRSGVRITCRALLGLLLSLWGLAVGFVGCFLIYVWAFTDHVVAHRNQNIFPCAPWSLALVVLGIGVALGRARAMRAAWTVAAAALAATLAACLLKVGFVHHQDNGRLLAFFLPAWIGVCAALTGSLPARGRD